ncbi:MAG: acyl-CoA/acyl-ACP dehydrogenase [Planctomycetales bacterium]|nr:acyl-CoA/acyl-ACP dehydrogenase [Planctomycetales bacterium]
MPATRITSPDDLALDQLRVELAKLADGMDRTEQWPAEQLQLCADYGVYEWFVDPQWGGQGWETEAVVRGYLALSSACLTTTFILTQRTGACRRIASSTNQTLKERLLPELAQGSIFATVGISHLTTSRRHLARPVLRATQSTGGFVLDGLSPWVTGAAEADHVVIGATLMIDDAPTEKQLLVALPTELPGVSAPEPAQLVGVSASRTGELRLDSVFVDNEFVLAGPTENVMLQGIGASTGGHETSTLALGLSAAAIDYLASESERRPDLEPALAALREDHRQTLDRLFAVVRGEPDCSTEQLRQKANSLALRTSQAALAAAKGTGYVLGHLAGRWCREALFFLVWSCPQPVLSANLCELAGIAD